MATSAIIPKKVNETVPVPDTMIDRPTTSSCTGVYALIAPKPSPDPREGMEWYPMWTVCPIPNWNQTRPH